MRKLLIAVVAAAAMFAGCFAYAGTSVLFSGAAPIVLTTLSWSSGTVTVLTSSPHSYTVGEFVTISGCTPSAYW
jgi:hypothetical protein